MSLARGGPRDLVGLAHTIQITQKILERLNSEELTHAASVEQLTGEVDVPLKLAKRILDSIDEEGLLQNLRIEESEAEVAAALAEAGEEIAGADYLDPAAAIATPTTSSSTSKRARVVPGVARRMLSEKDMERAEAWIMRKRFGISYYSPQRACSYHKIYYCMWLIFSLGTHFFPCPCSASETLERLHGQLDGLERKRVELETKLTEKIGCLSIPFAIISIAVVGSIADEWASRRDLGEKLRRAIIDAKMDAESGPYMSR